MYHFIADALEAAGLALGGRGYLLAFGIFAFLVIASSLLLRYVILGAFRRVLAVFLTPLQSRAGTFDQLGRRISRISVTVVAYFFVQEFVGESQFAGTLVDMALLVHLLLVFFSCAKCVEAIYDSSEAASKFPIHGIVQIANVGASLVFAVASVSLLTGQSPAVLLGGLGAATAIVTLVFKDAILGFVAGIHLIANKIIQLGDWIEVPLHSANGTVVDISMTTVKVENLDKTVTQLPAYTLVTESFVNWQNMVSSGRRRIKRPILIDAYSVGFLDGDALGRLSALPLPEGWLPDCGLETNLGAFRAYVGAYLRGRADICRDMTLVVRQLDPEGLGIPVEVIAFADKTAAAEFEAVQSDIFEHLYAVVGMFGLRVYQRPSG